jgi:hypothetical protein
LKRDADAQKHAPEVYKQGVQDPSKGQSRSYSTSARRLEQQTSESSSGSADQLPTSMLVPGDDRISFLGTQAEGLDYPDAGPGHKFPLPSAKDLKVTDHLRRRYDPVIDQFTKMIMEDGKLTRARKV